MTEAHLPDPSTFLSGAHGEVGGRRGALRRAGDVALDRWLATSGTLRAIDAAAARVPAREVLIASVYRPPGDRLSVALQALHSDRHRVRLAIGSTGAATLPNTALAELRGGKFENLNALLGETGAAGPRGGAAGSPGGAAESRGGAAGSHGDEAGLRGHALASPGGDAPGSPDWLLVVDDDVVLPQRFLDRMIAVAEALDLALAQPAQSLASHAAWAVTRRRPRSLARETRFVEIGPVTLFRRDVAAELLPFPPLRFGWGLDLAWAALALERGWRLGIVDALAVRHDAAPVGSSYPIDQAINEARAFLADRPYLSSAAAQETVATHRRLPR